MLPLLEMLFFWITEALIDLAADRSSSLIFLVMEITLEDAL